MTEFLETETGRRIAYNLSRGRGPAVVFCGGLRSDMGGTKALFLEEWAQARERCFLRFDYSGHGESSGRFEDGTIGDWLEDTTAILSNVVEGPLVLVGSSLGGWLSLLYSRANPDRLAGLVTIAAAPDFTEDSMWAGFSPQQRIELMEKGTVSLPSGYGEDYIISRGLIENGRENLVLRSPLTLNMPVRMLHGTADEDVELAVALRLLEHASGGDIRLVLAKDVDHRFSDPESLQLIEDSVEDVLARSGSI